MVLRLGATDKIEMSRKELLSTLKKGGRSVGVKLRSEKMGRQISTP